MDFLLAPSAPRLSCRVKFLGLMEKKMETLGPFKGISRDYIGFRV